MTSASEPVIFAEPVARTLHRFSRDETTFRCNISARMYASLGGRIDLHADAGHAGVPADAPRNKLYVDPLLPDWLPD